MFKTAIATLAATAAVVAPSAALAGPYVNVEANSAFTGSDYRYYDRRSCGLRWWSWCRLLGRSSWS